MHQLVNEKNCDNIKMYGMTVKKGKEVVELLHKVQQICVCRMSSLGVSRECDKLHASLWL